MEKNNFNFWPISQLFILLAAISIVFTVLKLSSEFVIPLLISIALAIILSTPLVYLESKRIPKVVSLIFIVFLVLVLVMLMGGLIGTEANDFAGHFHELLDKSAKKLEKFIVFINGFGITLSQTDIETMIQNSNFSKLIKMMAIQVSNQFSNLFLILFTTSFILLESEFLYNKIFKLLEGSKRDIAEGMEIITKIQSYFVIKVQTSFLKALFMLLVLWFFDIKYFCLWAALIFFLNFIPVIGPILAMVPPILVAIMDQSLMTGIWVTFGFIAINTVVGNILEPRMMSKGLGLSVLVVFLSMTFWGWLLGPVGMILSVPLTMVIQFLFNHYDETKWVAFLLSDYKKEKIE